MQIWLGVENFAKIESARICVNRYTLLAGQNNSGKTFLMQLIQGVTAKLMFLIDADMLDVLFDESEEDYDSYMLSHNNIERFICYLNDVLHREKENLIREIFGKNIPIEKLYMDIELAEEAYCLYIFDMSKNCKKHIEKIIDPEFMSIYSSLFAGPQSKKMFVLNIAEVNKDIFHTIFVGFAGSDRYDLTGIARDFMDKFINRNTLFLPSSRTGLLLLYREFFLNKTDYAISYEIGEGHTLKNKELYGGLTKPVYEFLRFLQMYSESRDQKEEFKEELKFFEDHVIDGHISTDNQRIFFYQSKDDENETPMYLASSMINETAPISMAVTSDGYFRRLIIDEIEASLHPEKQLELVRFLNRIYRKGMSLIVSTHSDTFVSKMNNLYILSQYKQQLYKRTGKIHDKMTDKTGMTAMDSKDICQKADHIMADILEKLGLNPEDLIDAEDLYVYEFVVQPNGKSFVKEIRGEEKAGFQFDLFTDSAMKIYNENLKIGELQ